MFRYYQTGEKTKWTPIAEAADVEKMAKEAGAKKLTILSVSEVINDETTDKSQLAYKGPLYFDIDMKEDLAGAAASANELVRKLIELGVPKGVIEVYASGSKGFHVIVPASLFSTGRQRKNLPSIYREMALDLHVLGMDFQVYSGGRGVSWRIANLQREDGNYRVPLLASELEGMTPEKYAELVSAPRAVAYADVDGAKAPALEALFNTSCKRAKHRPKTVAPIADSKLEMFKEVNPPCVSEVINYRVRNSVNFNQAALQLGIFTVKANVSDERAASLASRMAETAHSSQYDTPRARRDHIIGLTRYLSANSNGRHFSCAAIRATLSGRVCEECPMGAENASEARDAGLEVGIVEKEPGYYRLTEDGEVQISTFTLDPVAVHIQESENGHISRRIGTMVDVKQTGQVVGTLMFSEEGWASKSNFIAQLQGVTNLSFIGSDTDIQRIKHIMFQEDREMGEVVQVHSAGMHIHHIAKKDIFVYVEPGLSVNQLRVRDTHVIGGRIPAPPKIHNYSLPKLGDEKVNKALDHLLSINSPEVIAQVLGWFSVCHLKLHLMKRYSQFPLLNIWGNAGSGKSMTAGLFGWINGCDYTLEDSPVSLASITNWAMLHYCSCTTTAPRLLEEYNKSKMSKKMYDYCGEVMKAAWNSQVMARGTLARTSANGRGRVAGAELVELPISSPLVVMSEQAPQMPALQHRMVQVMLTTDGRRGCEGDFNKASQMKEQLAQMSAAMVYGALMTSGDWVEERMEALSESVPDALIDRPRYSYIVTLLGLEFFELVAAKLSLPVAERVVDLKTALIDLLKAQAGELTKTKHRTEVDAVFESLGIMAELSREGADNWLIEGKHYAVRGRAMYLDLPMVHALYSSFRRHSREAVVIDNPSQLGQLLQQESYFLSAAKLVPEFIRGRTVYEVDLDKMAEKGHIVSMFTGS